MAACDQFVKAAKPSLTEYLPLVTVFAADHANDMGQGIAVGFSVQWYERLACVLAGCHLIYLRIDYY